MSDASGYLIAVAREIKIVVTSYVFPHDLINLHCHATCQPNTHSHLTLNPLIRLQSNILQLHKIRRAQACRRIPAFRRIPARVRDNRRTRNILSRLETVARTAHSSSTDNIIQPRVAFAVEPGVGEAEGGFVGAEEGIVDEGEDGGDDGGGGGGAAVGGGGAVDDGQDAGGGQQVGSR